MGWGRTAVYSHASRLIETEWAASVPMAHGAGSLIYAAGRTSAPDSPSA